MSKTTYKSFVILHNYSWTSR